MYLILAKNIIRASFVNTTDIYKWFEFSITGIKSKKVELKKGLILCRPKSLHIYSHLSSTSVVNFLDA